MLAHATVGASALTPPVAFVTVATIETPTTRRVSDPASRRAAIVGLLQVHQELTRALDAQLSARHRLGLSAYEVLAHLSAAEDGHLRLGHLADRTGLSLSRVSRVMDGLERRGLTARASCAGDSRVVHAEVTDAGRDLVAAARATFDEVVQDVFLGRLDAGEVEALGALLGKVAAAPLGSTCPGSAAEAGR